MIGIMRFTFTSPNLRKKAVWGHLMLLALLVALATPAAAQTTTDITAKFDDAVREAWNSGSFSRKHSVNP